MVEWYRQLFGVVMLLGIDVEVDLLGAELEWRWNLQTFL